MGFNSGFKGLINPLKPKTYFTYHQLSN